MIMIYKNRSTPLNKRKDVPERRVSDMHLSATAELQEFLDNFHILTGIRVAFNCCDIRFGVVSKSNDLCVQMQSHPEFHEACMNCDAKALADCQKAQKGILYRCHAGFYEYITPVFFENVMIGFLHTGKITDGSKAEHDTLKKNLARYGIAEKDFEAFYQSCTHFSQQQIVAACKIVEACVSHIYHRSMVKINYLDQMQTINHFISSNLDSDLRIDRLCKEFNMNRTELYKQFGAYCGTGIADFIREKRLSMACNLMQTSDLTITQIAANVGYADYNYFSKVFRKHYGVTPREYRKNA